MASNSPFKVPQSPSTTLMPGYSESRPRKAGIIIIDPNTGNEVVLNSTQMPLTSLVTTLRRPEWSYSNNACAKNNSTFTSSNTFAALNDGKKSSSTSQMIENTLRKPVISETEGRQRTMSGVASMMPQFTQTTPVFNSKSSQVSKETDEELVAELDPKVADEINLQCKNIIREFKQMHNIDDIIESMIKDEKSVIRTRHEDFVKSMTLLTMDSKSNSRTEVGKIFAELLSKKVISMDAFTRGIGAVLKGWNDYLIDYPQFFLHIADIIAPLLISKTAFFEFKNLKDACIHMCSESYIIFVAEVLQKILSSKETQNIWKYIKDEFLSLPIRRPTRSLCCNDVKSPQIMSSNNAPRMSIISVSREDQRMMPSIKSVDVLNLKVANKINNQCKIIIQKYEQMQNLDDIIELLERDEQSVFYNKHEEFVKSLVLITLNSISSNQIVVGTLFAELLSKNILSMLAITLGINSALNNWTDYLINYNNFQFFSPVAAVVAPLLMSKTIFFEFNDLKNACLSMCPENTRAFFIQVLQQILSSKETQNINDKIGGILWVYNKWRMSNVPLSVFMTNEDLNIHFTNDRVGVFLLSVTICDAIMMTLVSMNKMKQTESGSLFDVMYSWINRCISAEIIKCPEFVRALTIAIVFAHLKRFGYGSFEDILEHVHVKLLKYYIQYEPLSLPEIQAREVQCLYGIQIMSASLYHPAGMLLKMFNKIYQDKVISKKSFNLWKNENKFKHGFNEDTETKTMAIVILNSFFSLINNCSNEEAYTIEH